MLNSRLLHLNELMASSHVDAVVVNPGPTLVYLTGLHFHLMERPTLLLFRRDEQPSLILPELEAGKLLDLDFPITVHTYKDDPSAWQGVFDGALRSWQGKTPVIGVESTRLRFMEMDYLQKSLPDAKFSSADEVFNGLRARKDDREVAFMRKAAEIAQKALSATLPMIKPGVSEQEIASELVIQLFKAGSSSELPFAPIVAGGPNSANPHAVPSSRKIKRGDFLVIDWGATCEDYFSDLTRTFAIGEVDSELLKIYEAVKLANAAGRAAGKPGIKAGIVDSAARQIIEDSGFGKFFTHRTGHGLGMEAHEQPYIFHGNDLILEQGMTYTVEPGIYLSGKGGVRIEDNIVITENSCESLSDFPRDLQVL